MFSMGPGDDTAITNRADSISQYLASTDIARLHLGAGPSILPGWLNTDLDPIHPAIVALDAREPLPFDDKTLDRVFAEHLIEHLDFDEGQNLIHEAFRTLRPGGVLRLATPDLRQLARLLIEELDEVQQAYVEKINLNFGALAQSSNPVFTVNSSFYEHGHKFLYTPEVLHSCLSAAGFVNITVTQPLVSDTSDLRGIEVHGQLLGDERLNTYECMVLEGTKPTGAEHS